MKNKIVRIAEPLDALKQYFGYDSFRGHQFEAIESILDGEDICFYAPTSLGKSIVYQISALCSEGTTIVISPLIALMSDQVDSLVAKGINAVFYNSSLTIKQSRAVLENIQSGTVKLLYVAPETLLNDSFIEILQNLNIQMIFLDEAHVCSSWGHDFRSDYKKLGILRTYFPKAVFAALTATADEITRRDIDVILKFNNHIVFMHSFDRPNISYAAYRKYGKGQDQTLELIQTPGFHEKLAAKTAQLMQGLSDAAKEAGIDFCTQSVGGMFGLYFSKTVPTSFDEIMKTDKDAFNHFFHFMLDEGIYLAPSAFEAGFVSAAHTEEDIATTIAAAKKSFAKLKA